VLYNLLSNAVKFTTEGGRVELTAHLVSRAVEIVVADTGIGIAPEDQERIFEEFSQLESALQRRATGAGLGLPLSRKLAELLGGKLTLASTPGVGSVFTVSIPVRYVEPRLSDPGLHAIEAVQHA
jgi:signal transduction histidine kinase